MTAKEERTAAAKFVLADLADEVKRRQEFVDMGSRGSAGDAYRREILRLWRLAARAVALGIPAGGKA